MQTTKLSSKGQVIIPKILRSRYKWEIGQELTVIDIGDGILLKSSRPFKETNLAEVAGVLKYSGKSVSLNEMEKRGVGLGLVTACVGGGMGGAMVIER